MTCDVTKFRVLENQADFFTYHFMPMSLKAIATELIDSASDLRFFLFFLENSAS